MKLLIPNVALNGEATQSSSYRHIKGKYGSGITFDDPDGAHYAIDGNFGTDLDSGDRCAVTNINDAGAWWQVDLKYEFEITKVAMTTRKNCKLLYLGISCI